MALYPENSSDKRGKLNDLNLKKDEAHLEEFLDLLSELKEENLEELLEFSAKADTPDLEVSEIVESLQNLLLEEPKPSNKNSQSKKLFQVSNNLEKPLPKTSTSKPSLREKYQSKLARKYDKPFEQSQKTEPKSSSTQGNKDSGNNPNSSQLQEAIAKLEAKIFNIEHQLYEPTELINPLLPLITELLSSKTLESRETFMEVLVPVIDEAIKQRTQQDKKIMGEAIADILPTAIIEEIHQAPTEIAKAIAPEIAIAIQEQIRLDPDSIAKTLGPEMGDAIKNQIIVEKDAMVDALYPVIGNTISKYMMEMVQTINEKVESAFSIEGLKRKLSAKLQGISEAELILRETLKYRVQAVLLIHKESGLIIRDIFVDPGLQIEAEMLAGMLTAIRSFVYDCIIQPNEVSELHEIEYDASKIILEVAGYCYLAVVVKGEPSRMLLDRIRETLSEIILKYSKQISIYDGDPAAVPNAVTIPMESLAATSEAVEKKAKPPTTLLILLGIILGLSGFWFYRAHLAHRIETDTSVALDAAPELSVYRITPEFHWGKLTLTGRVPNQPLREAAGKIATQVTPSVELDNQILAVEIPSDPVLIAGEVERVTWIFNQRKGIAITTHHDYGTRTVKVSGIVPDLADIEQITEALEKIPGVSQIVSTIQILPILETRIYFESNSTRFYSSDVASKITTIRQFLEQNPGVHLKIIGHTDDRGQKPKNQELGIRRARVIEQALIAQQVNPARLHIEGNTDLPPDVKPEQPLWLSRCVRFEVFIPSQTNQ